MITITPPGGHIGADIHGIDPSQPLEADEADVIREALFEHLALFFREQKLASFEQLKGLAHRHGQARRQAQTELAPEPGREFAAQDAGGVRPSLDRTLSRAA